MGKENTMFKQHEKITLTCEVSGYPMPFVKWYKNNTPLQKSERVNVYENYTLDITDATLIDGGTYTCR